MLNMPSNRNLRVACWFSSKKKKKLSIDGLRILFKKHGVDLSEINFEHSLDEQGQFDAVIHKFTDLMIEEMSGNGRAAKYLSDFQRYLDKYPATVLIDPLSSVRKLLNRFETYKLIQATKICSQDHIIHVPTFCLILTKDKDSILKQMKEANVQFPIVCKKNIAHGTASHKMSLIFNESGLADVDPPCVAQTFIDHNALLYKVLHQLIYVIADKYHMVKRPSLKNFTEKHWTGHPTIFFNSHDISSGDSLRSKLTTLEDLGAEPRDIDPNIVGGLARQLHHEINMTMFGVDVIVCPDTLKHYVIDVNVFPGYDGVENYQEMLVDAVMAKLGERCDGRTANGVKQNGATLSNGDCNNSHLITNGAQPSLSMNGATHTLDL